MKFVRRIVNIIGVDETVAFLDLEGLKVKRDDKFDPDKLWFRINSYKNLVDKDVTQLGTLLRPSNNFMEKCLTKDEKIVLANFFIDAKIMINQNRYNPHEAIAMIPKLGELFYDVAKELLIVEKLIRFVVEFPYPPDLHNMGNRPQDTKAGTFKQDDFYDLTTVSVICKLLGPIWGDIIYNTKTYVSTVDKEVFCVEIVSPILSNPLLTNVTEKLNAYIRNIVKRKMPRNNEKVDFAAIYSGQTYERFCQSISAVLLVKRFVSFDLLLKDCNIMKYVSISVERHLTNQLSSISTRSQVLPRDSLKTSEDSSFESSVSMLENDSRTSRSTADIPILSRYAVKHAIPKLITKYGISQAQFDDSVRYYMENLIAPSTMNKALISALVGTEIGGAYTLQYLDNILFTQLAVITQLHLAKEWQNQLTYMITSRTNTTAKREQFSTPDERIMMGTKTSMEYTAVKNKFQFAVNDKDIVKQIESVQEWVIFYEHIYNVAPTVINLQDDEPEPVNGTVIKYDEQIIRQFCTFISKALSPEIADNTTLSFNALETDFLDIS